MMAIIGTTPTTARYWGFVPNDNIIGTPVMVYMSLTRRGMPGIPDIGERMVTYASVFYSSRRRSLAPHLPKCFSSTGHAARLLSPRQKEFFVHGIRRCRCEYFLADQAKQRIRRLASRTFSAGVIGGIGSFGGLFALDKKWREPVLVSSADGVGTKLKIAAAMGIHSTVGGDLVNHCVNDILTLGAEPLFFLDYLAMGKMDPNVVEQLVEGMSRACHSAGCALIGGETAEMPVCTCRENTISLASSSV